jgi:succinoglycan biosynthesis transport protein ExoP
MAEEIKGFTDHLLGFTRHLKLAAATAAVVIVIGVGFAYSLPDVYRSSGYILIEEPAIPETIMRSTVTTYATRQLTTLNETILVMPTLMRLVEDFDLYAEERATTPLEVLALRAGMAIGVNIETRETVSSSGMPRPEAVGFSISFEDENPELTKIIADEIIAMYLEQNLKLRSEQTAETSNFLKSEVILLEAEIGELEGEMARFKEKNADRLPSLNSLNLSMMSRLDTQLLQLEGELQSLEQVRITIAAQLVQIQPSIPTRLADGSYALSPHDQLKQLQSQLSVYQGRYSDDHPDVVATRRDIESLRKRFGIDVDVVQLDEDIVNTKAKLALAVAKYSSDHPDVVQLERKTEQLERQLLEVTERQLEANVAPDNPAFIQLTASLDVLDAEENVLQTKIAKINADMADYEQRLHETPQIEKELAALSRTLSSTSNRYWVMRDKQFAAEMGETLETQSKGEEMILIEPPRVPLKPYKPNRGAIITLAFLFALVAGFGITQLADAMDKSIRSGAAIVALQGVPPLVEVPYIYSDLELAHTARMKRMTLASIAPVFLAGIIIMHFTVFPLDVLWYSIANRLGF